MTTIAISLEVDDKGSVVVNKFSEKTVQKVKNMSTRSIGHVQRLSAKFTRGLGGAVQGVGKMLMSLKTLAIGALAGWGLTKIITKFSTFETALADMGKVTSESFDDIKNKIMDLPASLGSATELVQGYYQVLSAGVKGTKNQMDTLTTASKLAKTAHTDQGLAITGLSSVMDAFKVGSMNAADALQTIEKTGKTTVGGLIPIIGELSSSSAALGLGLNEMGAAFAAVTQQSGGTEKAATQFKALMTSLIAPTAGMSNLLAKYGGAQKAIKAIGFGGVLKLIADATKGNATETKKLLGSVEGYMGFLSASANDMQTYNQNLEEQKNKTGAVDQAWKNYQSTLRAMWETFKNTIGRQVIWIGEKLAPNIKAITFVTNKWLEKNKEMITSNLGGWATKAGQAILNMSIVVVKGLGFIPRAFYTIIEAGSLVNQALAATGAAVVMAVGFIAASLSPIDAVKVAIYGFEDTFPHLTKMKNFFDDLGNASAEGALKAEASKQKFAGFERTAQGLANALKNKGSELKTSVQEQIQAGQDIATAEEQTQQRMMATWQDKIVQIDGTWTNVRKKIMVPFEPEITLIDQATPVLDNIQTQTAETQAAIERSSTFGIDDQATPVLDNIQSKLSALQDKTITVTTISRNISSGGTAGGESSDSTDGSYRYGTDYVPKTGLYQLHQGEKVVPSVKQSSSSIKIGDINIIIPESAAPQRSEDWREITRTYILPELERLS